MSESSFPLLLSPVAPCIGEKGLSILHETSILSLALEGHVSSQKAGDLTKA